MHSFSKRKDIYFLFSRMHLKQDTSWCASINSQMSNTGILNTKNAYQICNDIVVSFNMFTNCDNL